MININKQLSVEAAFSHYVVCVLCRAVVDHSLGKNLPGVEIDNFESIPGQGLAAVVNVEVTLQILYH